MWKHFPCTLPNFGRCKGATFSEQKKETVWFLIHISESCTLAPWFFSIYFFGSKTGEIDHAVPSEVVYLRPSPPQFFKYRHVPPHSLHNDSAKIKTIILCSICTHTQILQTAN
jgi:hypothetical protein